MPTAKKTKTAKPVATTKITAPVQTLSTWLLRAPIKFSLLFVGLMVTFIVAVTIIASMFAGAPDAVPTFLELIISGVMLVIPAYAFYKLVRWSPANPMDRRSFVALSIIVTAASLLFTLCIAGMGWLGIVPQFWMVYLMYMSPWLFFAGLLIFALAMMYLLGLYVAARYVAAYWRARKMGMSKWKFILAFPFGWALLLYPFMFLPEEIKTSQVLSIKTNWLSRITEWTVAKTSNAVILLIILPIAMIAILLPAAAIESTSISLIPIAIFFGLWAIYGTKKMNKSMSGWFANMTVILNVLAIATVACFMWFSAPKVSAPTMPVFDIEQIEITEQ
ncbi:MAG: hypothetical protein FWF34_03145 [Alphaproteobacteria bacterium]|nr:hypothetical protein [Alphaproteobacteria bacterium]MCL2890227.1 hypothetical protein [Alphaproteobacteria bacterium]